MSTSVAKRTVQLLVGNTYNRIATSQAQFNRSGKHRKVHDWKLYVDVVKGDPDIIDHVAFDLGQGFRPQTYICTTPIPIMRKGMTTWRYYTRQQSSAPVDAKIFVEGNGGSKLETSYQIQVGNSSPSTSESSLGFTESRALQPRKMNKISDEQKIGIELELTSAGHVSPEIVADSLRARDCSVHVNPGVEMLSEWKIVPDDSIVFSRNLPNCNKFELVSPILTGRTVPDSISNILERLDSIKSMLKVNKSMGFHVHVDVSEHSLQQLVKICQNFIKYEDVMDTLMPPSRRTGSSESSQYFRSNRQSVAENIKAQLKLPANATVTNKHCHDALGKCMDLNQLVKLMNSGSRYHKLNLQNLVTGRQTTLEFRQHSATINNSKVGAWVRFCVAFCSNSAKLAPPTCFKASRSMDNRFTALFCYVIKDRALRDFYRKRQCQLKQEEGDVPCCDNCTPGEP
jgi:hypothetical protein